MNMVEYMDSCRYCTMRFMHHPKEHEAAQSNLNVGPWWHVYALQHFQDFNEEHVLFSMRKVAGLMLRGSYHHHCAADFLDTLQCLIRGPFSSFDLLIWLQQ